MDFCATLEAPSAIDAGREIKPQRSSRSRLVTWLTPDLALTIAIGTILFLFLVSNGATSLFTDSDTGWHIRTGERMLATGSLPHAEPYSFSKPGETWIAWEWIADVAMGLVYRAAGLAGVALLFGLCIGACVWMWFRLNRAVGGNFLIAGLFFVPMLPTTTLHWLARPHIFSWLFLLGTVWVCETMPRRLQWRQLAGIAMLSAVWANAHASFFFGPLIALCYALGAYVTPLIWAVGEPSDPASRDSGVCRSYLLFAASASLGSLANPNGWHLHQHLFSYLLNSALLDQITEFQSFNFHSDGAVQVMLALAIAFTGGLAALSNRRPARFLLSMLLAAVALRSVRALPVAALLSLPLANGSITAVLSRARDLTPAMRRLLDSVLAYGDSMKDIDRQFRGFALVPLVALGIFLSIRSSAGFPPKEAPVAASDMVASLPANARILSTDAFGGYLIYRFNGERKVFFDGRSDFYGTEFMQKYLRLVEARPGWRDEFRRWKFTHALLPPDCRLIAALEGEGWHQLYRDKTAVLLAGHP